MKSARRRAREYALQGLYQWQVAGNAASDIRAHLAADEHFARADGEYFAQLLGGTIAAAGELAREGAAARVGMLFQQGALFSAFSVLDNIAFALRESGALPPALVREAALLKLQMVGLKASDAHKMPAELSGGMIKRVALARALIMDPPLLMLDEPTAGLDPDSSDAFVALLRALHQELGLTVVMVTHDLDTLFELSSRVAVLADKRVIINAPVPEVLAFEHPFIRHFFLGERGRRAMELLRQRQHARPAQGD